VTAKLRRCGRGAPNKGIEQNATSYTGEERRLRVCSYLTRWADKWIVKAAEW
jgi:hypothetical protein